MWCILFPKLFFEPVRPSKFSLHTKFSGICFFVLVLGFWFTRFCFYCFWLICNYRFFHSSSCTYSAFYLAYLILKELDKTLVYLFAHNVFVLYSIACALRKVQNKEKLVEGNHFIDDGQTHFVIFIDCISCWLLRYVETPLCDRI